MGVGGTQDGLFQGLVGPHMPRAEIRLELGWLRGGQGGRICLGVRRQRTAESGDRLLLKAARRASTCKPGIYCTKSVLKARGGCVTKGG